MRVIKGIACFGEVYSESNFEIVCAYEEHDTCWTCGSLERPNGFFDNWEQVVEELSRYFPAIQEITSV